MRFRVLAAALLTTACAPSPASMEGTPYGEPLTLDAVTPISLIADAPEVWLGQRVLVRGTVVEVCAMKGCWMDLASDGDFETIRVKVDDGVITFPLSARGKTALVEGTVEKIELTREEAVEQARHHAEEAGEPFDPESVTGPRTIYQVRGIGAVVADDVVG